MPSNLSSDIDLTLWELFFLLSIHFQDVIICLLPFLFESIDFIQCDDVGNNLTKNYPIIFFNFDLLNFLLIGSKLLLFWYFFYFWKERFLSSIYFCCINLKIFHFSSSLRLICLIFFFHLQYILKGLDLMSLSSRLCWYNQNRRA